MQNICIYLYMYIYQLPLNLKYSSSSWKSVRIRVKSSSCLKFVQIRGESSSCTISPGCLFFLRCPTMSWEVKQSSRAHGWIALQSVYHVSPCEQNIKKNVAGHFSITNDSFCILPTACLYRLLEANLVVIGQLSLNIASRKQNTIPLELKLADRARLCAKRMKNCYSTRRHVTGMHKSGKTIQVGNKKT